MGTTIDGKPAGCSLCAFSTDCERIIIDESKPVTFSAGTRRNLTTGANEPVQHECRACKTVVEPKCCADREPADFPAAGVCARYAAR